MHPTNLSEETTTRRWRKSVQIVVKLTTDAGASQKFIARIPHDLNTYAFGATPREAIGRLVVINPNYFCVHLSHVAKGQTPIAKKFDPPEWPVIETRETDVFAVRFAGKEFWPTPCCNASEQADWWSPDRRSSRELAIGEYLATDGWRIRVSVMNQSQHSLDGEKQTTDDDCSCGDGGPCTA